jgi:hypothetical protein
MPGSAHLAAPFQRRRAPDDGDLVLLHQESDASVEPARHLARALHHRLGVVGDLIRRQAVVLGVLQHVEHLGRAQQGLGRDAPPVEADATQVVALDDRRLEAELRRPDGGDIASRPRPDDDDVEGLLSHGGRLSEKGETNKAPT